MLTTQFGVRFIEQEVQRQSKIFPTVVVSPKEENVLFLNKQRGRPASKSVDVRPETIKDYTFALFLYREVSALSVESY